MTHPTHTDQSRALLHALTTQAGLSADGAEPIRLAENALWRLPTGIVVRIARPGQAQAAVREITVTRWLAQLDFPAVRPLAINQPVHAAGRTATFWEELPPHHHGTTSDLAPLLRRLHDLPVPHFIADALGHIDPFIRLTDRINTARHLNAPQRDFLHTRLTELHTRWTTLDHGPERIVHGDAWTGNTAVTPDSHAVLLDFERTALGPPQWDLTSTAVATDTLGNLSPTAYQQYATAYGHDVRTWEHYPLFRDIRELRLVTFAFQIADHTPTALPEAHHRLACLQDEQSPRPWGWTPVG
ncbi:aminoglycoside phosphotransferase family protein [Streptomyces sp. NPDC005953]|uniref:aminoglycoside phosphotransferase family protein n=1 Tax=Streptomyces sp. NPDC005953 TaxID=3156719 RepID=UPI003406FD99